MDGGVAYMSLANGNTDTPPSAKWNPVQMGACPPVVGSTRNLKVVRGSTTQMNVTADEIITETVLGGIANKITGLSVTLNIGTVGINGMDTGAATAGADLFLYAIGGPGQTPGVLATVTGGGYIYSGSHMPAGYTQSALIGAYRMDGSAHFTVLTQFDNTVYIPSTLIASGLSATSLTAQSVVVPANAKSAFGTGSCSSTNDAIVAADAAGTGQCAFGSPGSSACLGNWDIPLIASQTLYYSTSTNSVSLQLSGYRI